ncbi:MAG: alpha/beta fold hydrolase [Burkholderiales bacterium]|nr:alpha/beta fold hydrolase [Burkholderiales bacterium]
MNWLEINGVGLRYELSGAGAQTVVLVHELGGALESWDETLPVFREHFRVLRYDQRGFGLSEKARGTLGLDDMVADVAGLLDALALREPCHVVGSALGAGIAAAFAARHPARVARLVVQSLVTCSSPRFREQMIARAAEVERTGMRAQAGASLDRSYPEVLRFERARFERYRLRWIANDPGSFAAVNRMLLDMDVDGELAAIRCPTLAIGCVHDVLRKPEMVKELATKIAGARYVEADSGHFMHVQSPGLFAEMVVPFLREGR